MDLVEISQGGMSCFSLTEGSQGRAVTTRAVLFRTGQGRAGQGRTGQGRAGQGRTGQPGHSLGRVLTHQAHLRRRYEVGISIVTGGKMKGKIIQFSGAASRKN